MKLYHPILVGEANPYGGDPDFALYPLPEHSAGGRLQRLIFAMRRVDYLDTGHIIRVNLCQSQWDTREAARRAADLRKRYWSDQSNHSCYWFVLLGKKVRTAFGLSSHASFTEIPDERALLLPHPSGLCREWNEPSSFLRARELLRARFPYLPIGSLK